LGLANPKTILTISVYNYFVLRLDLRNGPSTLLSRGAWIVILGAFYKQ